MKKRAEQIFHQEILSLLAAKSKEEFDKSLTKIASLADILDQSGDAASADKMDDLLKQAGFWSSFLSGLSGGGGAAIWDAVKNGKFRESLNIIAKKAVMGAVTGVGIEYIIKWLDEVPLIGPLLKELEGADKIRSILEGVVAGAVADSDIANQLVDKTIEAVEGLLGFGKKQEVKPQPQQQKQNIPGVASKPAEEKKPEPKPAAEDGSDTAQFQMATGSKKNN